MNELLQASVGVISCWLDAKLPALGSKWWVENVVNRLTFQQQRLVSEAGHHNICFEIMIEIPRGGTATDKWLAEDFTSGGRRISESSVLQGQQLSGLRIRNVASKFLQSIVNMTVGDEQVEVHH